MKPAFLVSGSLNDDSPGCLSCMHLPAATDLWMPAVGSAGVVAASLCLIAARHATVEPPYHRGRWREAARAEKDDAGRAGELLRAAGGQREAAGRLGSHPLPRQVAVVGAARFRRRQATHLVEASGVPAPDFVPPAVFGRRRRIRRNDVACQSLPRRTFLCARREREGGGSRPLRQVRFAVRAVLRHAQ